MQCLGVRSWIHLDFSFFLSFFFFFFFVVVVNAYKISILKIRQVKGEEEMGWLMSSKDSAKAIALYNLRGNTPRLGNMEF